MHDRMGEKKEKRETNYRYLREDLYNLLHFLLKVCFQYSVSFIDHEALPNNEEIQSKRIAWIYAYICMHASINIPDIRTKDPNFKSLQSKMEKQKSLSHQNLSIIFQHRKVIHALKICRLSFHFGFLVFPQNNTKLSRWQEQASK